MRHALAAAVLAKLEKANLRCSAATGRRPQQIAGVHLVCFIEMAVQF